MKTTLTILAVLCSTSLHFAQIKDFHLDQEYAIAKDGTIDLRSSDAKVYISGTNRTAMARVKIDRTLNIKGWYASKGSFSVDVESNEGNLIIQERKSIQTAVQFGYVNEEYTIKLEVPEGVSLQIKGDDGDYWIKNIQGEINLDIDDGNAEISNCNGNKFTFNLDDGNLKMTGGKGSLSVDANDADLTFENASFASLDADMDDGKLIIQSSLSDNGNYTIRSQDGLVVFDVQSGSGLFSIRHDDSRITAEGNFSSKQESEHFTELALGNGTAKVNIRADDASIRLRSQSKN